MNKTIYKTEFVSFNKNIWIIAFASAFAMTAVFAKDNKLEQCNNITIVNQVAGEIVSDTAEDYSLIVKSSKEQKELAIKRLENKSFKVAKDNKKNCLVKINGISE